MEVGKAMGARVVAAVSSEGKALAAAQAGADRTLVYPLDLSDRAVAKSLADDFKSAVGPHGERSEEHKSELQSLMRNSYALYGFKKKKQHRTKQIPYTIKN